MTSMPPALVAQNITMKENKIRRIKGNVLCGNQISVHLHGRKVLGKPTGQLSRSDSSQIMSVGGSSNEPAQNLPAPSEIDGRPAVPAMAGLRGLKDMAIQLSYPVAIVTAAALLRQGSTCQRQGEQVSTSSLQKTPAFAGSSKDHSIYYTSPGKDGPLFTSSRRDCLKLFMFRSKAIPHSIEVCFRDTNKGYCLLELDPVTGEILVHRRGRVFSPDHPEVLHAIGLACSGPYTSNRVSRNRPEYREFTLMGNSYYWYEKEKEFSLLDKNGQVLGHARWTFISSRYGLILTGAEMNLFTPDHDELTILLILAIGFNVVSNCQVI
ncbi:hypothetical protein C8J56DRAFT_917411 [Mycena floridula]|nr:hypothetical protein C8J56DRAFT_917411 [Mycena floridula]